MSKEVSVNIEMGYRGTVTGISRSGLYQRATFQLKDAAGRPFASSTLLGTGENIPMKQEVNDLPVYSFGPFKKAVTISVFVENSRSSDTGFVPSKAVLPVTVRKDADAETPQTFIVSTILSEDSSDNDYNDGIISIFQYK